MTTSEAKAYLSQIRKMEILVEARMRQLDKLRRERVYLRGGGYDRDRVQTSGISDPSRESDRLLDLELEISRALTDAVDTQNRVLVEISHLQTPEYVDLLLYRYLEGLSFEQIGELMGYSYGRITHMHGDALQAFGRMMDEK